MPTKSCSRCNNNLPLTEFHSAPKLRLGVSSACKSCMSKRDLELKHTRKGLVGSIYSEQKSSCKVRNHPYPTYTLANLHEWISLQPSFTSMYDTWVSSGYDKWSRPSIDRLDNEVSYTLSNIRLTTFKENNSRSHRDAAKGSNLGTTLVPVDKFSLEGNYVCSYISMTEASKDSGVSIGAICVACGKEYASSKSWLWRLSSSTYTPKYRPRCKVKYSLLNESGSVEVSFTDGTELKLFLNKKDLSPLRKAIRKGSLYLGKKWIKEEIK